MRVVLCNCSPGEAEELARKLVAERLAACVNIIPGVRSYYIWEGTLEKDEEATLLIKTPLTKLDALRRRLLELHSYDTVEFLSLPVLTEESDSKYVNWVRALTKN